MRKFKNFLKNIIIEIVGSFFFKLDIFFYVKTFKKNISIHPKKGQKLILILNTQNTVGGSAKISDSILYGLTSDFKTKMIVKKIFTKNPLVFKVKEKKKVFLKKIREKYINKNLLFELPYVPTNTILDDKIIRNADLIHLHNPHDYFFNLLELPKISSIKPIIWTLHDLLMLTPNRYYYLEVSEYESKNISFPFLDPNCSLLTPQEKTILQLRKKIFKLSNFTIVTPSKWLKKYCEKGILSEKEIIVINNGINTKIFKKTDKKTARQKLGLPLNKKIVLFIADGGRENIWKGGKFAENAIKEAGKYLDIVFITIGGTNSNMDNNLINLGFIENQNTIALYYSAADVLLAPSLAENFPLNIIEALSCGTPAVAFRTGGIPEIIDHNQNGFIADYKDQSMLNKFLIELLKNDSLNAKFSQNCILKSNKHFSIELMISRYESLYHKVLDQYYKFEV